MPSDMTPVRLRCEYQERPLGLDVLQPRLSWQFDSDRHGAAQTAYEILAASSTMLLDQDSGDLWESGWVESDESIHVAYEGRVLKSAERVFWKVRVTDEAGNQSRWSSPASWEMGLLSTSDWKAKWIGSFLAGGPRTPAPAPFLRRSITLKRQPVEARLYATALGVYEFRINGRKVGEDFFAPGWTDYRKRIQYQVYDVSHLLSEGENALGAVLGDGWYCGNVEWRGRQLYGDRPWLFGQLVVQYDDGTTQTLATDKTWKTSFGPILESDMLMGESYDAQRELTGWDNVGYDDKSWQPATLREDPGVSLVAMRGPTVKATQEIVPVGDPVKIERWPSPDYIYDLGQNMVGFVRLKVKGPAGKTVRLRFGEVLTDKGTLYTENLRSAKQTDYYTLKGDPDGEVWEPRFTFHGFRYVEVRDFPGEPTKDAITGIVVHSDTPKTGEFECNDELINQLQQNIDWGQRGNFVDVPTDCPQRDERLGWTGDAQVFVRTAAFNRDVAGFFTKWADDCRDAQSDKGEIPPTVPTTGVVSADGGPAWADAAIICPWTIYLTYGDTRILEENYDVMVRFMDYLESTANDHIRCYPDYEGFKGFGDWLSIKAETPQDLIGTAFLAYDADLMSRIAGILGKQDDQDRYAKLFETVKAAFQKRYVTPDGLVTPQTQTAYLLALHFNLLPERQREVAAKELVADMKKRGWHLSAGFVGSSYVNPVLSAVGMNDVAFKLLHQKTWPSWLYAVTKGATTIWERWDGWTEENGFQDPGMNSFNHYAYGAIGSWLYEKVAGIDVGQAGYKQIRMTPTPGEGITWVKASLNSIHGRIESNWAVENNSFTWDVLIPPNTSATLEAPPGFSDLNCEGVSGGRRLELSAGRYRVTARHSSDL
ncbi:MAG: family 78 glycoside hydrolase catalytic domain [Fimbriimonas sp.]